MKLKFNKKWKDFKNGFGELNDEFFLGLEKVYKITNQKNFRYSLRIDVITKSKVSHTYTFSYFKILSENRKYALNFHSYKQHGILKSGMIFETDDKRSKYFGCYDYYWERIGIYNGFSRKQPGWWYYNFEDSIRLINGKLCFNNNLALEHPKIEELGALNFIELKISRNYE